MTTTMYGFGGPTYTLANLGLFQTTDPFFDANEFLSFAQGAYLKVHHAAASRRFDDVRGLLTESMRSQLQNASGDRHWTEPIQNVVQASVLSVAHDSSVDTVTVRIAATSTAKKHNQLTEDWTFTRPAANWGGLSAPPVTQCPSCGAPADVDEHGVCRYCRVPIKGVAGDWRLIGATVVDAKQQRKQAKSSADRSWNWFWGLIIFTTVVVPLVITVAVLWVVHNATNEAFTSFDNSMSSFGNQFPSSPKSPGAVAGNVTMTSGLSGGFTPQEVVLTGATTGTCPAKVAAATGFTVHHVTTSSQGVQQDVTITIALPEGKKGQGTYEDATATVTLVESPTSAVAPGAAIENNTWTGPATAAISASSGSVTMTNLAPADPKWSPFAGTLTITCS